MILKVLAVEDEEMIQNLWRRQLEGKVEIISAFTIKEAEGKFSANPDVAVILMDGCMPGNELNTLPLVRKFRETFTGQMIATSSRFSWELVKAGCSYECAKTLVPSLLLEILGLPG